MNLECLQQFLDDHLHSKTDFTIIFRDYSLKDFQHHLLEYRKGVAQFVQKGEDWILEIQCDGKLKLEYLGVTNDTAVKLLQKFGVENITKAWFVIEENTVIVWDEVLYEEVFEFVNDQKDKVIEINGFDASIKIDADGIVLQYKDTQERICFDPVTTTDADEVCVNIIKSLFRIGTVFF